MVIAMTIQIVIRVPIVIVWAILRMTNVSSELSIVTASAVAAILIMAVVLVLMVLPRFKRIQENTDRLNLESRENLTGIRVVRAYNAEGFEQKKFGRTNENWRKTTCF